MLDIRLDRALTSTQMILGKEEEYERVLETVKLCMNRVGTIYGIVLFAG